MGMRSYISISLIKIINAVTYQVVKNLKISRITKIHIIRELFYMGLISAHEFVILYGSC